MKKTIAFILASVLICFSFTGCNTKITDTTTTTEPTSGIVYTEPTETAPEYTTAEPVSIIETTTAAETTIPATTVAPVTTPATTEAPASTAPDYANYTKAQIVSVYADALNKTRAYTGALSVHHKESFEGNVVEVKTKFAQTLATQLANYIMGVLMDPSEEDIVFNGGKGTNADGETVPILLPQRTSFNLPEAGVANATITESNGTLKIHIQLVREDVAFGEIPAYNSTAVGYLDTSKFSFNIVTVKSCTISYTGSTIDATIRPDGYIGDCTYVINLSTTGEVSGLGASGSGTIAGAQTEVWQLNW